ncbi:formimidoylglutamase [Pedobacter gandavensis]|uniref:Arginase n=1 Tax=Pedobacter gandavensis TaxID=2679963 RepID=A0ABR6EY55_9SPHI|nr:formimidoylglutamase [Pedobacter gandavensis]MBB2150186.1 arginase [Pedobacter gandavensis]
MEALKIYGKAEISTLIHQREGEVKLGTQVQIFSSWKELRDSPATFVLLGIPEDIGVRANHGIAGTATAWAPALKALLNLQSTDFLPGNELMVLGHFDFEDPAKNQIQNLENAVTQIDEQVYPVIQKIIEAGKTPIVIGGGHNNAYPILKGCAKGLKKAMDVLNIDAHADLRPTHGRHSGNGFSYAIQQGFLEHYAIFGLHQNYNNRAILVEIENNPKINTVFFDDLLKQEITHQEALSPLLAGLNNEPGLEIDLDCIENVLSSAFTPSGFQINDIRRIILQSRKKFAYMHVCEGASQMADGRASAATAKTIAYLVSDFIKAQREIKK